MFGYYRCVGDDKKNTLNCHKAIEDQEGQDSAARELCDGSTETSAGRGEQASPAGNRSRYPRLAGKVWQREAEDIRGFQIPHAWPLEYFSTQVKWRAATQDLFSYKNPKIGAKKLTIG